ncbi:MAG: hypothetical protein Kow0059_18040 [Candidatus Sumerlaeia bacterium]
MRWGLTRAEHWILMALVALVTIGIGANYYQNERERVAVHIEQLEPVVQPQGADADKININTATAAELDTLPGIGPAYAERIIQHRQQNGPFKSIEDLRQVKGIGEKTFENIRNLITVGGDSGQGELKTTGPVKPPDRVRPSNVEQNAAPATTPAPATGTSAAGAPTQSVPAPPLPGTAAPPAATPSAAPATKKININTATAAELDSLPGIGATYAQRIVEYRTANGPFKAIEDIQKVKGIGPATFEKLKPFITVGGDDSLIRTTGPVQPPDRQAPGPVPSPAETPAPPAGGQTAPAVSPTPAPAASSSGKININTATAAQLDSLPGIGPAYAQRIIDYRTANGPFKSVDELTNVKGIGPKTLENLRPFICVE